MSDLAPVLQEFFTRRLVSQRDASPATIAAYRDTFRLLLGFAAARSGKAPSALGLADLDATVITAFLEHLQADRGNSVRTRNARLAAIHSLFAYAALRHPEHGALIQRVLAIPGKRRDRAPVTYLTPDEADAMLAACDQSTRTGRRDHAMLALAVQAGLRVSELTSLTCADIRLQAGPHVHCTGKGRKERDTPLLPATVRIMKAWLAERGGQPGDPLFPGPSGQRLSRERRRTPRQALPRTGLRRLPVPGRQARHRPHAPALGRHALLLAGVDITVIALWLGHESLTSTQEYLHADMQQKQEAIGKTAPPQAMQQYDQAFQDAAAVGVTVCVATGDAGSSDGVDDGLAHVDFPASSPNALACGGTTLNTNAAGSAITSEVVWNDTADGGGATGGGISDQFALPSYQDNAGVPPSVNAGARVGRGVPDVAANADPNTGYEVRVDGSSVVVGGTSAVAPLWAGLVALLNQSLGKPVGFLNPNLYGSIAQDGVFRDITSGNNGAYSAGPGWDACTGWGVADGTKLLAALKPSGSSSAS